VRRFFELLEANADEQWLAPDRWVAAVAVEQSEEGDEEGSEFASAYEGMTYKDSADDGEEGSVAGGESAPLAGEFPLEPEADGLEGRLKFVHAVARLWRSAARPELWSRVESADRDTLAGWLSAAERGREALTRFLDQITAVPVPEPVGGHEGMIEFDRRRALKGHLLDLGVATCVEAGRAGLALSAVLVHGGALAAASDPLSDPPASESAAWRPLLVRLERAIGRRDAGQVRKLLPTFVSLFRHEPLLYCPPSDGGNPRGVLRAQTALHVLE